MIKEPLIWIAWKMSKHSNLWLFIAYLLSCGLGFLFLKRLMPEIEMINLIIASFMAGFGIWLTSMLILLNMDFAIKRGNWRIAKEKESS